MKRIITLIGIVALVTAGAVSCSKTELPQGACDLQSLASDRAISLRPESGEGTKAIIDTTRLPEGYTIYLSAFVTDNERPQNTGNYFTSIPFNLNPELSSEDTKDGGEEGSDEESKDIWTGTPSQYWPLSGSITFLGIATDIADFQSHLKWSDLRNTDGVTVTVPEDFDGTSEILYGYTPLYEKEVDGVPVQFHHTQALLEFNFTSECDNLVRLQDIQIQNCYTGGILYVSNYPVSYAKWDTDDLDARNAPVTDVYPDTPLDSDLESSYQIAIVPKTGQHFIVNFHQRANLECDWKTKSVIVPFEFNQPLQKWKAGYKYIYNFNIELQEITFTAETTNMDTGEGEVVQIN